MMMLRKDPYSLMLRPKCPHHHRFIISCNVSKPPQSPAPLLSVTSALGGLRPRPPATIPSPPPPTIQYLATAAAGHFLWRPLPDSLCSLPDMEAVLDDVKIGEYNTQRMSLPLVIIANQTTSPNVVLSIEDNIKHSLHVCSPLHGIQRRPSHTAHSWS